MNLWQDFVSVRPKVFYSTLLEQLMSRTIARKERMNDTIVVRCHTEDKVNLKLAAQAAGKDSSALVRELLIREKIINPV